MDEKNELETLLEILDLEYLKPLFTKYKTFDDLIHKTDEEFDLMGIRNKSDREKLRLALNDIICEKPTRINSLEEYNCKLTYNEINQILNHIETETNLMTSTLNFLLNTSTICKDDSTNETEYRIYNREIDLIESDIKQLQIYIDTLTRKIEDKYPNIVKKNQINENNKKSRTLIITTLVTLTAFVTVGCFLFLKRK